MDHIGDEHNPINPRCAGLSAASSGCRFADVAGANCSVQCLSLQMLRPLSYYEDLQVVEQNDGQNQTQVRGAAGLGIFQNR